MIELDKLNRINNNSDFSASQDGEVDLSEAFMTALGYSNIDLTDGYTPDYDVQIEDALIEIKMSKHPIRLYIEYERFNGDPSGLSLSKSDLYMVVNPGYVNIDNKLTDLMKMRIIPTPDLRNWIEVMKKLDRKSVNDTGKHIDDYEEHAPVKGGARPGPGSRGFWLDTRTRFNKDYVKDLFVLGFNYTRDKNNNISFDHNDVVLAPGFDYVQKEMNKYISKL